MTPWSRLGFGRAAGRRTVVVATAIVLALVGTACSSAPAESTSATMTAAASAGSTSAAPESASGLKTIDQAALQTIVDETAQELLVPGYLVLLRTPQGEFIAVSGTTKLGENSLPTADTHFRIASITKTMTSAVILLLAQEGKLSLDDPVSKYLPEVPDGDNISIAQLLEMRSGLYSFTDAPEISTSLDNDPTRVWKPQELLDIAFAQPPNFAPGAQYEYSNTNYVLLGLIIEQVDDKPIAAAFEDRLFEPLGLNDTVFPSTESNTIPDPFSHGYLYGSSSTMMYGSPPYTPEMEAEARAGTLQPKDFTDINHSFAFAAGAVTSTAADLATWMKALAGGQVLNAEYQRLWQDSAQVIDPANSYNWYGYGIDQLRWGSHVLDLHGGQTPGFNSEAAYDRATDMTLVIWGNLTMALDNQFTAQVLMLKVLDQIYVQTPLPASSATAAPTTSGG
ncbi:serine hydrolase domain-containing protein [Nakamurella sp. GG22]